MSKRFKTINNYNLVKSIMLGMGYETHLKVKLVDDMRKKLENLLTISETIRDTHMDTRKDIVNAYLRFVHRFGADREYIHNYTTLCADATHLTPCTLIIGFKCHPRYAYPTLPPMVQKSIVTFLMASPLPKNITVLICDYIIMDTLRVLPVIPIKRPRAVFPIFITKYIELCDGKCQMHELDRVIDVMLCE